MLNFRTNRRTE